MKKETIDNIIKLDNIGRKKTIKLCEQRGWKFEEPTRPDLAYDCTIKLNSDVIAVVEIKNRSLKCANYDTLFLQIDKYNNLLKWKDKLNADLALYINWIGDECYIFDIDKVEQSSLTEKWMNNITADKSLGKVKKQVYELSKKYAQEHIILL